VSYNYVNYFTIKQFLSLEALCLYYGAITAVNLLSLIFCDCLGYCIGAIHVHISSVLKSYAFFAVLSLIHAA